MVPKNLFINLFAIACSLPLLQHFVSLVCRLSVCWFCSVKQMKKQSDFEKKISTFFVLFRFFLEEVERNSTDGRQEEMKIP